MPIKFRCQHCRQFLGISHSKAGMLVDCPTCGRTIRVPDPEGKIQPLPELKLNLKDQKLASALDELANLGRNDAEFEPQSAVAVAEAEGNTPKPPTAPTGSAVEAAAASVPIKVEMLPPPKPIPLEIHDTSKPPPVASMKELAALANLPTARDPHSEQPVVTLDPVIGELGGRRNARTGITLSWVVSIAMVTFWLGFVVGRWDRSPRSSAIGVAPVATQKAATDSPAGTAKDPFVPATSGPSVRGRITYLTESGERRPDRGARVLLLPEKRDGTAKLAVAGFRAADSDADALVAAAGLRALGGDIAVVDDAGNFEVNSLKPGTYRILALSHFQPRDEKQPLNASLKGILDNFFDRSEQLLGKCRYHLGELKYSGKDAELWDHSFERE